jgi:hypothetical protein
MRCCGVTKPARIKMSIWGRGALMCFMASASERVPASWRAISIASSASIRTLLSDSAIWASVMRPAALRCLRSVLGWAEVSLARVWIAYSPIHFKSRWRAAFPSRGAGLFRAVFLTYQTLPVCVGNIRWVSTRSYGNFVIGQWVPACHRRVDMSAARLASLYS